MTESSRTEIGTLTAKNVATGNRGWAGDSYTDAPDQATARADDISRNVFVIYGRDDEARKAVFDYLLALRLNPLDWEQLITTMKSAAPSLADVVVNAPRQAQAVVALLTPDDVVHLHPTLRGDRDTAAERTVSCQARPNVFLELGMALALHPTRTIILQAGLMRETGDLAGLNYVRVDATNRWCTKVAQRLEEAGCPVVRSGYDWNDPDRFAGLAAFRRTPPTG